MSLVANVVRSAIAEAASFTMSQPQKDDSLIEIWLVCASAVIVSSPSRPPSTPLTVLNLAGPIPPRLRAVGACYRCRSAHPTCLVRGNADDGRPVRCCYGGLSHDRFHPPTPWPRSAPSSRTTERKRSGPSRLSTAADRHQCDARYGTARVAASAVAGTAICNHAVPSLRSPPQLISSSLRDNNLRPLLRCWMPDNSCHLGFLLYRHPPSLLQATSVGTVRRPGTAQNPAVLLASPLRRQGFPRNQTSLWTLVTAPAW